MNLQICSLFSLRLCCGSVAAVKHLTCSLCIKSLCFHCLCLPPSVLCKLDINMQSIKQLLHGPDFHLNWSRNVELCTNSSTHGCPIRSKCCTFSWFMVSHLSFYRRVHYFNHEAVLQETDFIISDARFELPLQSPCYLLKYTVTVQYKIAACFTPFFKILAPLRWDFSSYFETAGGF